MFIPNTTCLINTASGKTDIFGMPVSGIQYKEKMSIIKMSIDNEKTSVKSDQPGVSGNVRELETKSIFLLTAKTKAKIDDSILLMGYKFRIMSVFPRLNLQGILDHYEVGCTFWEVL